MRFAALQTLVLRPSAFFAEREPAATLPIASVLVVLLAVSLGVSTLLVGSMLGGAIDATVTMDNPDRPPEWVCDRHGDDPDSLLGQGCGEPATIERDAGSLVEEAAADYVWFGVFGPFLVWVLGAVVLNVMARVSNGTPTIAGSFALAGWAALPEFARLAAGLAAIHYAVADVTIEDPELALSVLQGAMAPIEPVLTVVTVLTVGWQWYLLSGGLVNDANLSWRAAGVAVGFPLAVWLLLALA